MHRAVPLSFGCHASARTEAVTTGTVLTVPAAAQSVSVDDDSMRGFPVSTRSVCPLRMQKAQRRPLTKKPSGYTMASPGALPGRNAEGSKRRETMMDRLKASLGREDMKRRIPMTLFGVLVCAFSVGLFSHSGMGVDPFQVLAQSMGRHAQRLWGLDYGTFYMILNLLMLVGVFFMSRSKIGLGTVMNIFLVGYIASFSEGWMARLFPDPGLPVRIALLCVAVVVMCFGSAFYFTGDLGVSTYDAVALTISEKTDKRYFKYIRIATDLLCVGIGCLLGGTDKVGAGTIITALFMGPLISFFRRTCAEPFRYGKGTEKNR